MHIHPKKKPRNEFISSKNHKLPTLTRKKILIAKKDGNELASIIHQYYFFE